MKKAISVLLTICMVLSLTACGAKSGEVTGATDAESIEAALDLSQNADQSWTFDSGSDAWTLSVVSAVTNPEIADEQGVSVCVPGAYVNGIDTDGDGTADVASSDVSGTVNGSLVIDYDAEVTSTNGQFYTAATAPVIVNTGAAGYSSQSNQTASSTYAAEGYINVACGNRGKQDAVTDGSGNTVYTGDAPCCLVDQKNTVRFVKYNILLGNLPGSVDYFVSTGGMGGGAPCGGTMPDGGSAPSGTMPDGGSAPSGGPGDGSDNSGMGDMVGTPDSGTTQSATGSTDSSNYASFDEMLAAYEADIAEVETGDEYGNNIVELYDPINYIGADGTENPVWTRIMMGAAEGDMSMFASLNLQIAWLNAGTDANIEWQWDGGHVPSEILDESLALYVDEMYGKYADGAVTVEKPAAAQQTTNGTATEATGTDISSWVSCDGSTVSFSLADAVTYRTAGASKANPGFDVMDYGQEDYVFGSAETDARHWDSHVLKVFHTYADVLSPLFNNG